MTELVTYTPAATPGTVVYATDPTGGRLIAWADGLAAAHRVGSALCQTAFVPTAFRGKPEEAAAAILYGDEIGLTPTQALQSVHVISGRPGLYARTMVALLLAHGHEVWTAEKSDAKVTVAGRRKGSTHVHEETWTTARAQKAGYTKNTKYNTDPQAMLYARAAADVCRQVAPDALAGLDYTVEELELVDTPTVTVTHTSAPATKAQRKPAAAPTEPAEPPLEPTPTPADSERMTARTRGRMFALFTERNITDPAFQRAGIAKIIGHEIASRSELTEAEGRAVIASLEGSQPAADEPVDAEAYDAETGEVL